MSGGCRMSQTSGALSQMGEPTYYLAFTENLKNKENWANPPTPDPNATGAFPLYIQLNRM